MGRVIPWEEIREKYEEGGWSYSALAREYGAVPSTVSKRARKERWKGAGEYRREEPVGKCLASAARQLSASVNETVRQGEASVKELKELTAMLRELVGLQETIAQQQKEAGELRVVMEDEAEEWSR